MSDTNPPVDHVDLEDTTEAKPIEENLKSRSTWLRLVFMIAYYFLISVATIVGSVVVVFGFLWVLFTGDVNRQLRQAGQAIAAYMYEIVRYLTYNTDTRPFPFGAEWPAAEEAQKSDS